LLTSCRFVAAFDQIAIKSQSSSLVVFGFHVCLCGRSPQKASMPFVSHERLRRRCTSLVLDAIAASGLICPNALLQCLSALRLRGGSGTGFRPPRLVGISLPPGRPEVRTDVNELFPRGRRIEHGDMTDLPTHDKPLRHGTRICIPRNVKMFGKSCFADSNLESITFESDSRLTRIEDSCFECSSLKSICIPRNVDFIAGSAFTNCNGYSITVDQNNHRFLIDRHFVIDNIEMRLVRYFGDCAGVVIWKAVEILGQSCFADSKLELLTFESDSRLTRIEDSCFQNCSLKSICIPRHVEMLGKSCFAESKLELLTFENDSRLTRIEDSCFQYCSLKEIFIPNTVQYIGTGAFDDGVTVITSTLDSIAEDGQNGL
jgi:hypothetical protein